MTNEHPATILNRPAVLYPVVVVVAAAVRFAYALIAIDANLFPDIFLDSRYYASLARQITLGHGVGTTPYLMSPLYPYLLAMFTGAGGELAAWSMRTLQFAGGCFSAVLISALARRQAGIGAGWVAGIVGADP